MLTLIVVFLFMCMLVRCGLIAHGNVDSRRLMCMCTWMLILSGNVNVHVNVYCLFCFALMLLCAFM